MKVLAPAKINLFLEVKNRRPDGYHNIESIMQTVNLYDEIYIEPGKEKITFKCNTAGLPTDKTNLVFKAAMVLKETFGIREGAKISLIKHIPVGAGLGGGSSDAAAVLKGLVKLWKIKITLKNLSKIASKIGADVPFFLTGGTAIATGIGDTIKPVKRLKSKHFILIFPGFPIFTSWVYQNLHFPLTRKREINRIYTLLSSPSAPSYEGCFFNRLEEVVFRKYSEILIIKKTLEKHGCKSLMSGSGAAVFGEVSSAKMGEKIKAKLRNKKWKVWVVKSI
ncbi:4-(cytidine 5'-diphospho)-2-C-methyl-D-erythritol kinase [Elusimicrobiota bacterium]